MAFKITCEVCEKEIEGLTERQAEYLMAQHQLTHKFKEQEKNANIKQ